MFEKKYTMAKRVLTAMLLLMALTVMPDQAQAQEIFSDLAGMSGVESTYVSGRFAHNKKYWSSNSGLRRMDLREGFSSLYSYQCYSEESVAKAKEILKQYLKKNPDMEVMMKTTQGVQEYVVYEKFMEDGKKVTQMIIWNCDSPNMCEVVVINWNKGLERGTSYRDDRDILKSLPSGLQSLERLNLDGLAVMGGTLDVDIAEKVDSVLSGVDWGVTGNREWGESFDWIP